jgi:hypothetical protein
MNAVTLQRGKETDYEDEFEDEYDWGTRRRWEGRGRSQHLGLFLTEEILSQPRDQ